MDGKSKIAMEMDVVAVFIVYVHWRWLLSNNFELLPRSLESVY